MNTGVELGSDQTDSKEPIVDTNSGQDWYQSLSFLCLSKSRFRRNTSHTSFNVIRRKEGEETITEEEVPQVIAYRMRKQYREQGYRVDLIEVR